MTIADEYLASISEAISAEVRQTAGPWGDASPDYFLWNLGAAIHMVPEVSIDIDMRKFEVSCTLASAEALEDLLLTPGVPESLRQGLASHPLPRVRRHVAATTRDRQLWERLRRDSDALVRAWAVFNEAADESALRAFASDPRAEVRASVADTVTTPTDVLEVLSQDRSAAVRWELVTGPNSHRRDILAMMLSDPDPHLATQARILFESLTGPHEISERVEVESPVTGESVFVELPITEQDARRRMARHPGHPSK